MTYCSFCGPSGSDGFVGALAELPVDRYGSVFLILGHFMVFQLRIQSFSSHFLGEPKQ